METFFNPRSVAVVGASEKPNLGNKVVQNLKAGFPGEIYPINPNYKTVEGLACYPSIDAISGHLDLVIVLVPAKLIPAVLNACAAKGTKSVIIESAGFNESGEQGKALQAECDRIARKSGIRIWGPNCMGLVDVRRQYFFTFMHPRIRAEGLLPGNISLIVQSGMMSAIFLLELAHRGIGVAKACSIGNRADLDECEILEYLEKDPDTKVIALYLESIPRGRRLATLVRKSTKPIVLLPGGQSEAGATAAISHTSSLSGNSRLLKSVLANEGVVIADSVFQMMDIANTLCMIPKMNPAARIAIVTLSGGAGILACDALEHSGLTIATLSEQTKEKLMEIFPPWMPPANPIDLFPAVAKRGRVVAFRSALQAALSDEGVDAVVIHFVAGLEDSVIDLKQAKETADQLGKTVVFWLMGIEASKRKFKEDARKAGIAVYSDATGVATCLSAVARYNTYRQCAVVSTIAQTQDAKQSDTPPLTTEAPVWDEFDSKHLLSQWEIPVVSEKICTDADDAWLFAQQSGTPVVLKGLIPGKAHKSEHGLVKLGLSDRSALLKAHSDLTASLQDNGRIIVQKQMVYEYELIAGFLRDPQFGPCIMFGLGGVLAELTPDVEFCLAPLSLNDAIKLMRRLRNRKLLEGFRGISPIDESTMAQLLVNLGNLGAAYPQIEQIDINPLVVYRGKPVAVDATVVLRTSDNARTKMEIADE